MLVLNFPGFVIKLGKFQIWVNFSCYSENQKSRKKDWEDWLKNGSIFCILRKRVSNQWRVNILRVWHCPWMAVQFKGIIEMSFHQKLIFLWITSSGFSNNKKKALRHALKQRCPTIFLRSPQLWRINKAIRHIFAKPSLVTNMSVFLYFHILSHLFSQYFVVSKCELNEKISILVLFCQNQPNFEVFGNKAIRHI